MRPSLPDQSALSFSTVAPALFGLLVIVAVSVGGPAAAQSEFCANPSGFCAKMMTTPCLSALGAGAEAAPTRRECRQQLDNYRDCVSSAASDRGGAERETRVSGGLCAPDLSRELWALAEEDGDCGGYEAFLEACPESRRAPFARSRLRKLQCDGRSPTADRAGAQTADLDQLCANGGAATPPRGCRDHVVRRVQTIWRTLGRRLTARWGLNADCKVWLDFAIQGDTLTMSTPDGASQSFNPMNELLASEAAGETFNAEEIVRLSPSELVFAGSAASGRLAFDGFDNKPSRGEPHTTLQLVDGVLQFSSGGRRLSLNRCR